MNPSKDGGIPYCIFFMSNMKERKPSCLKHIDPRGRVVLSDGMRTVILHVTQLPAFQSKQVSAGCKDCNGKKWFSLQVQHQLSSCLDSKI